jgi:ATP-dependent helicase/nuclease subunit B
VLFAFPFSLPARYHFFMKTILCPLWRQPDLYHALAGSRGFTADVRMLTLQNLLQPQEAPGEEALILQAAQLLQAHADAFPRYRAMLDYPAFVQEVLSFARELALYAIPGQDLPEDTDSERELKGMLSLLLELPLPEKDMAAGREERLAYARSLDNLSIDIPFVSTIFEDQFLKDLKAPEELSFPSVQPQILQGRSLSPRQELEAIVQRICVQPVPTTIVLTSYETQYPVLKILLERYGLPYSCLQEAEPVHVYAQFSSLCRLALHPDADTLFAALTLDAFARRCPGDLRAWLKDELIAAACPAPDFSLFDQLKDDSFSRQDLRQEKEMLKKARRFFAEIQPALDTLRSVSEPRDILTASFDILRSHPEVSQDADRKALYDLRRILQECAGFMQSEKDLQFLSDLLETKTSSRRRIGEGLVRVTDLRHPVFPGKITYVTNCTGDSFPGFAARQGLFDEDYVRRVPGYPALEARSALYHRQLGWLESSCTDALIYTRPLSDYEGRELRGAYEVESLFPQDDVPLDLTPVRLAPARRRARTLQPDHAQALTRDSQGVLTTTVYKAESWFTCPYKWFLESALDVHKQLRPAPDARLLGSLQHAVLQRAQQEFQQDYPVQGPQHMEAWLAPDFAVLAALYPRTPEQNELTRRRLLVSLAHSFRVLADFEANTAFRTEEVELRIEKQKVLENLAFNGRVDRLDVHADSSGRRLRVVDYKSSGHSLDEKDVQAGLSLQLLVYLWAMELSGRGQPEACYYFSLRQRVLPLTYAKFDLTKKVLAEQPDDSQARELLMYKGRQFSGWCFAQDHKEDEYSGRANALKGLKSSHEWQNAVTWLSLLLAKFTRETGQGEIARRPVAKNENDSPCRFCDGRRVCCYSGSFTPRQPQVDCELPLTTSKRKTKGGVR